MELGKESIFKYWEWSDTWIAFLVLCAVLAVTTGFIFITAAKPVMGYYLEVHSASIIPSYCVKTDIDWYQDVDSACFADPDKAIEALLKLKGSK